MATREEVLIKWWRECSIREDKKPARDYCVRKIVDNKGTYQKVERETGVPWWFIGLLHQMESGFNFSSWLANGDPLSGPTIHAPAGLASDGTWANAAIVTIHYDKLHKKTYNSVLDVLDNAEQFNGFGYWHRGLPSHYLWAFSNVEKPGRYVRDGIWDPSAMSGQCGIAVVLQELIRLGHVTFQVPPVSANVLQEVTWFERHRLNASDDTIETGIAAMDKHGRCRATFRGVDRKSMQVFLDKFPNATNDLVAPPNKLWPAIWKEPETPTEKVMRLTRTGRKEPQGCEILELVIEGTEHKWLCISGQPHAQVFQKGGPENIPGSMQPLPEGEYNIENIVWAEKDSYTKSLGAGLGPLFVPVTPKFNTRRGSFGIHQDVNAYSTAGCIGIKTEEELRSLVKALRQYDPKTLHVVW